jgi:NAD(P) transhydrogenase subunit alpha
MARRIVIGLVALLLHAPLVGVVIHPAFSQATPSAAIPSMTPSGEETATASAETEAGGTPSVGHESTAVDYWPLLFVFALSTFIGIGVIARVSRLLHTPLMSITNAISAIAVVGSIIVTGSDYPKDIRILGAVALFASMTNIVSGFLITDRMLKMFKQEPKGAQKK